MSTDDHTQKPGQGSGDRAPEPRAGSDGVLTAEVVAGRVAELEQRLSRRIRAIEADQFTLTEQMHHTAAAAQRAAGGLDELEEVLAEVDDRAGQATAAMELAMQQRHLALHPPSPHLGPPDPEADGHKDDHTAPPKPPEVAEVHAFVERHIAPLVRKTTTTGEGGGIRWCRQWWLHIDAVERFTALFIVWAELSRQDDLTWLSGYYRDHLDPHLTTLTSPFGPFHACTPVRHSDVIEPLGHAPLTGAPDASHPRPALAVAGLGDGSGHDGESANGSGGGPSAADGRRPTVDAAPHAAATPDVTAWPAGGQTGRRPR